MPSTLGASTFSSSAWCETSPAPPPPECGALTFQAFGACRLNDSFHPRRHKGSRDAQRRPNRLHAGNCAGSRCLPPARSGIKKAPPKRGRDGFNFAPRLRCTLLLLEVAFQHRRRRLRPLRRIVSDLLVRNAFSSELLGISGSMRLSQRVPSITFGGYGLVEQRPLRYSSLLDRAARPPNLMAR